MRRLLGGAIYRITDFCLRMAQPEFFRRILIVGQPLDDRDEHVMVVANHPYGIQDAFLISLAYRRSFYFVATAMNFQRRSGDVIQKRRLRGWFLKQCHVLPIVRDRAEGHMSDNLRTFQAAAGHIADGDALGIFAEGDSRGNQWRLLKLKIGAAQIALQVADLLKADGRRLKIQVVGITYTNWDKPFKSSVTLRLAEPLAVDAIDMHDKQAVRKARKEITDQLTRLMQELTVHIPEEHHNLVGKIAQFYCAEQRNDYSRLKAVGEKVTQLSERYAEGPKELAARRKELEDKLDEYLGLADRLKVYPGQERVLSHKLPLVLLAAPAYLGLLTHLPILWATRRKVPRQTTVLHALGSKRVTWGISFAILWYALVGLAAMAVGVWQLGVWGIPVSLAALLAMATCGVIASRFYRHVNLLIRSVLPSWGSFARYLQLGRELYQTLETYRHSATEPAAAAPDASHHAQSRADTP